MAVDWTRIAAYQVGELNMPQRFSRLSLLWFSGGLLLSAPESAFSQVPSPGLVVRGEPGPRPIPLRIFQADVQTSLLAANPGPGAGGAALSVIVHTKATPIAATAPGELAFLAPAPQTLTPLLNGLVQQLQTRHRGWFTGKRMEISIEGATSPADAASSTLAIAVAMDAMIAGWVPDEKFHALGSLQPDGQIAAVSQPIPRLLAAYRAGGKRIAVPDRMWAQVADLLVAEGPAAFSKAEMFTVGNFEELPAIATDPPNADIQRASVRFSEVQRALQAPGVDTEAALISGPVKEALREVLVIAPRHLTARLLLGRTTGQYKNLSVPGSVAAIEAMGATLLKAARSAQPSELSMLPLTPIQAEATRLKAAKVKLDPKSHGVVDALLAYADVARAWHERPAASGPNRVEKNRVLYAAAKQIRDELARIAPPS